MEKTEYKLKDVLQFHLNVWRNDKEMYMIWIFIAYMILAGTTPLLAIIFPRYIIDAIANSQLNETMILVGVFGVTSLVFGVLQTRVMYFAEGRFLASRIRSNRIYTTKFADVKFANLENTEFHKKRNEAQSAMGSNNGGFQGTMSIVFYQLAEIFSIVVLLIILGTFNYLIIVVALGCSLLQFLLAKKAKSHALSKHEEITEKDRQAQYFYRTSNDFSYGKDIRVNELEEPFTKLFKLKQNIVQKLSRELVIYEYRLTVLDVIFLVLTNGLTYYLVVNAYFDGFLSLGEIAMTILGVLAVTIKMQATFKELARLKEETGKTKKYIAFMNSDIYNDKKDGLKLDFPDIKIEFENVSFKYPSSDELVLKDVSFVIDTAKKTALVGINGSGKTTIIKLICGLYQPTTGRILINGVDATTLNQEYFRRQMAVVFQDVNIYATSVLENIAGENPNESERKRAITAMKEAGIYDKVMSLEHKENHQLLKVIDPNGTDLSGGETQKIAIARALYKENTKMIILDEPTSALDAIAEKEIYEKFNEMTKERTTIMISHRLASTRFCDDILFLENGEILENGSHDDLMSIEKGKYQEMFTTQGKYYVEGDDSNEL